jgi:DNA-binding SARP family transcriptional activator
MPHLDPFVRSTALFGAEPWPIQICLLGDFCLLQSGKPIALRSGGKTETLLCYLGFQPGQRLARPTLLELLWPNSEEGQASQSLNSLVYSIHKQIGHAIGGAPPVLHKDGYYRLNSEAGVGVDVAAFEALAQLGDQQARAGDLGNTTLSFRRCVQLYRGDLCVTTDVNAIVERERLRARYLSLLSRLADYSYYMGDDVACMEYAWRLLGHDPCREDAHRVVMRCYVQRGERAAALRHYQMCADILRSEFDAAPELATAALFDQIRRDPARLNRDLSRSPASTLGKGAVVAAAGEHAAAYTLARNRV